MDILKTKTKLVFFPLLLLGVSFIIVYALLYWLLCIQLNLISLKQDIVQYWIPAGLSFSCVLLYIRPRIHLLKLDKDNGRVRTLYYMVGAAVFCIPSIITLNYLDTATGKLTALNSISEIAQRPQTKYYTVNRYILNKERSGFETTIIRSGKHNEYLNFNIYIAVPFMDNRADTMRSPSAFLSIKYHKQISSRISGSKRTEEWNEFWNASSRMFDQEFLHFKYLDRIANTDDRDNFLIAAKDCSLYKSGTPVVILKPVNDPFEERNGKKVGYIFLLFGIGTIVWFIMIMIPGVHENKAEKFKAPDRRYITRQLRAGYDIIKIRPGFTATPILIAINILIFTIMVISGLGFIDFYTRDLIPIGAVYEPAIQKGEWWRLISGMFLHGGVIHLFMNMFSLYLGGIFLENFIGTKKFIIIYFLSGIAAALISLSWHDKPVVAVGASGAIFGLYGVLLYMIVFKIFEPATKRVMLVLLGCTAGYSLLMGLLSEGVDNSAHVGGLIAGFILGMFFVSRVKQDT